MFPAAPAFAADPCGGPTNIHQCSEDPPTASFGFSPTNPSRRDTVTFTGKAAANPDRTLKSTRWDLYDDGEFSDGTALTARRTFYRPGRYRIRLRVEDDHGAVTTAVGTVTVAEAPGAPPARPRSSLALQANAMRDGFIAARAPAPPLRKVWSRKLGPRVSYAVIAGKRIFVSGSSKHRHGSHVYALDRRSGAVLWSRLVPANKYTSSEPAQLALDGDRLFAEGASGLMVAFDASSGRRLWARQQRQDMVPSAPLAHGGIVWTGGNGIGGTAYAYRQSDGALLWYQELPSAAGPAAVDANNLYIAVPCPGVFGMDRFTGFAQWWYHGPCTGGSEGQAPVLHQGKVWGLSGETAGHDGGWVVRATDGALLDTFRASRPPAFKGDLGLFLRRGGLTAVNLKTHARTWRFRGNGQLATPPLIVGRFAYFASWSGHVYGVNVHTGRRAWRTRVAKDCPRIHVAGLAAGDGTLVVPCDGRVFAFASAHRR